ncbi:hypothetical protein MBLNU457_g2838t1 [Dothideomycetes sp. NU457]
MPPKAAAAKASAPKKTKTEPAHGTYQDMIKDAIIQLKDRAGSSRQALKKYVLANNNLGSISDAAFTQRFNHALSKGTESGAFVRPKGASGTVKLGKGKVEKDEDEKKPAAPKTASKPKTTTATKKTTTKKTAAAPKKAAPAAKKASTTTTKKAAAKPKANTSKPRKTAPAPAVEDKAPVVLGKTKSGRVTKTKAPSATKKAAPAKKAAPKKAAAKK